MSRSVFVPWGAVNVAYAAFECSDCPEEFSDSLVNAEYALREKYPSLEAARGWIGNEGRVFLENSFARIVVAEYCGLVSISAVPTGNPLAPVRYRVALKGDDRKTTVSVLTSAGGPDVGENGRRIAERLVAELR